MIKAEDLRTLTQENKERILLKEREDLEALLKARALAGKAYLEIEHISHELQQELTAAGLRPSSTMIVVTRGNLTMMAPGFNIVW